MSEVIKETLNKLKEGSISVEEAYRTLASYDHLGYATLDIQRERRKGFPEIIFGEGKSREHLLGIFERLMRFHKKVVATRVDQEKASYLTANLKERYPTEHFEYRNDCNIFYWISHDYVEIKNQVI